MARRWLTAQRAWLALEERDVVPGIVDGAVAREDAGVLADHGAVLEHDDPIGVGVRHGISNRWRPHGSPCTGRPTASAETL
jgi:hypothetical protein